jgi:hypothetical protein
MKYTVKMGSVAITRTPSFIKSGSGIQQLREWGFTDTQTHRQHGELIGLLLFLKTRKVGEQLDTSGE